jgi:hypothetical protein
MTKYTPGYQVGSLVLQSRGNKTATSYEYYVHCLVCREFKTINNIKLRHIEKSGEGDCGCTSSSLIYFIRAQLDQHDFMKIGRTGRDISSRFAVVQTHCPMEVKIEKLFRGSHLLEHEAHEHFKSYRKYPKREWFYFTPSMLTWHPSLPFEEVELPPMSFDLSFDEDFFEE